ncbi:MAG: hypothetical protein Q7T03_07965 [Deltaproteobacteria bacterium]|nr:hypothetical protein [Deltaproteobacteria bacterium]
MTLFIGQSTSIVFRTLPYIFLRFLVYSLFALLFLIYAGVVFLLGLFLGRLHPMASGIVWFLGFVLSFPLVRLAKEYLLYLVKAGHVAVIAELATKGSLPPGVSQIQWGRDQVQKRFKEASTLFLVDRLVNGVIHAINRTMGRMGNIMGGVPGMQGLLKLANVILYFSLTYVDESILARNFIKTNEPMWESAKKGIVLYAQSWKEILATAIIVGLIAMVVFPVLFVLLLMPALALGVAYPSLQIPAVIAAFAFAVVLKGAFLDPWTLTNMILTYLKTTEGMTVSPEWESKLESLSSKFKQLKEKAKGGTN